MSAHGGKKEGRRVAGSTGATSNPRPAAGSGDSITGGVGGDSITGGGGGGDLPGEWKITSELLFGRKKPTQDGEILPVLNRSIPMSEQSPQFSGIQKTETCGHQCSPVRRVCTDGFDFGRRFLVCPKEGYDTCGYLKWMDEEWKGRARTVIHKLAEENLVLQKSNMEKDKQIACMKEERKVANVYLKHAIKSRDRRDLAALSVIGGCVLMYALLQLFVR